MIKTYIRWLTSFGSLLLLSVTDPSSVISHNAVISVWNIIAVVMYTDNYIHEIVVKRNPSSSRKRSRDGIRSHITPAKKRSSFTSTKCTSGEQHNCAQDMTENKGTELVSSLLFLFFKRYTLVSSIMMFFCTCPVLQWQWGLIWGLWQHCVWQLLSG